MIELLLSAILAAESASGESFTLDWILDYRNLRPASVPRALWLPDETLLLEDRRPPGGLGRLQRLEPRTLKRSQFPEGDGILESWRKLPGESNAPGQLGFPQAVAADGKSLLYIAGGDLYLVNVEEGSVRRLTSTEALEKVPRLSPDGRWISYSRDHDLYAYSVEAGRERRLTHDGSPSRLNGTLSWVYWEEVMDRRDEAYWWSPDSGAILYLQTDEAPVVEFPIVDWSPPSPAVRWQRYPKAGAQNPPVRAGIRELSGDGTRWLSLGASDPEGRDAAWTGLPGGDSGGTAPEYIVRAAWTAKGDAVALATMSRSQDRLEIWLYDRRPEVTRKRLHVETWPTWINLHEDWRFLEDGSFLWSSEREGLRRLYLRRRDASAPDALTPVTPRDLILQDPDGPMGSQGALAWVDFDRRQVYFHAAQVDVASTQFFRTGLDGASLSRLSEGDGTHRVVVSPKGGFYIDTYSRWGIPPRLTLHRIDGTLLDVLAPSNTEWLDRLPAARRQLLVVPADDGTPLHASLVAPEGTADQDRGGSGPAVPRRYPAIVQVYGGPGMPTVRNSWDGFGYLWESLLVKKGYCVFSIDPRSASDSGKAREDFVFRRAYGDGEMRDILAGVRYLKGLSFVDADRVGIWGWSGGGSTTLYAMTHSDAFRSGIAVAGVTDWRYYDTFYAERYLRRPEENAEGYRSSSAASAAAGLHGRLLIVHGTADDNVHVQNALRMADALIGAGKQFEMMLYPGRDHGIGDPAARRHLYTLMLDFWDRSLKAGVWPIEREF